MIKNKPSITYISGLFHVSFCASTKNRWYHGRLTRKEAENLLVNKPTGSFLVRQSETGNSNDYSLSLV